ncbi:BgMFREP16.2 [Biomphalaria glabrata]
MEILEKDIPWPPFRAISPCYEDEKCCSTQSNGVIAYINKGQTVVTAIKEITSQNVTGEIYDNKSIDSYLQVEWKNIKISDSGKYVCEAHVQYEEGKSEKVNEMLTITVQRPTLGDLVNVIQKLISQADEDKENVQASKQKIENIEADLNSNKQKIQRIREEIETNKQNITINSIIRPKSCRNVTYTEARVIETLASGLKVMCDTKTDCGGWIIIQRRINGKVDFYRGWKEYRDGFGDYNIGEFYLGNENIFKLTSTGQYDLRIDLEYNNNIYFAQYKNFKVLNETEKYKLQIGNYSGNAGDSLLRHNNMFFTTFDRDNDIDSRNCAVERSGAWWYYYCSSSNLNGKWENDTYYRRLQWTSLPGSYRISFSEMKIRERK